MDKYIGRILDDRYEVLEVIGVGGMAVVYKGLDKMLDRHVAIKVLKDEFAYDEDFRKRFANESHAVARLSHNNIVSVFDVSRSEMPQYIVMELIEGISLKEYLTKKGALTWQETLFFTQQIAKALEHAHSRGIIHQDIKPHNICLLRDGTVKVTDFGIARFEKNQETQVIQEAIGSVHYISPEQAKGSKIDNRADLYSLGVMMFEMLTGRVPFDGDTPLAIVMQHINGVPPAPSQIAPGIPSGMDDVVLRAMHPVLNKRYASATDIYNDLEQLKHQPTIRFESVTRQSVLEDETMVIPPIKQPPRVRTEPERAVRIEEKDDPPPRPRHRSFWGKLVESPVAMGILCVLFCVAIAGFAAVKMLDFGADLIVVPSFIDQNFDTVRSDPQYMQFIFEEATSRVIDNEVEPGTIVDQSPAAGDSVRSGTTIVLTVTEQAEAKVDQTVKRYVLDDFTNKSINMACLVLDRKNIPYQLVEEANLEVEKDTIIRTEPTAGTMLTPEDKVILYVSTGAEGIQVPVPKVVGRSLTDAQQMLWDAKLIPTVEGRNSDAPENEVIEQSIAPDTMVNAETKIKIVFSLGSATVPEEPIEPDPVVPDPPSSPEHTDIPTDPEEMGEAVIPFELPADVESAHVQIRLADGSLVYERTYDTSLVTQDAYTCTAPIGQHGIIISINGKEESRIVTFR